MIASAALFAVDFNGLDLAIDHDTNVVDFAAAAHLGFCADDAAILVLTPYLLDGFIQRLAAALGDLNRCARTVVRHDLRNDADGEADKQNFEQ